MRSTASSLFVCVCVQFSRLSNLVLSSSPFASCNVQMARLRYMATFMAHWRHRQMFTHRTLSIYRSPRNWAILKQPFSKLRGFFQQQSVKARSSSTIEDSSVMSYYLWLNVWMEYSDSRLYVACVKHFSILSAGWMSRFNMVLCPQQIWWFYQ